MQDNNIVNFGKKASNYIKKQTERVLGVNKLNQEIGHNGDLDTEVDVELIENEDKSEKSLSRLNDIHSRDIFESKIRNIKNSKREQQMNLRLDEVERRLYRAENDIKDDEENIIKNSENIELLDHRTEACETRIRVVEDRITNVEKDIKYLNKRQSKMNVSLKKEAYSSLYLAVKKDMELRLNYRNKKVEKKCFYSLSFLLFSMIFIYFQSELSMMIGSLFLVMALLLVFGAIINSSKTFVGFLKIRRKTNNNDLTLLEIIKSKSDLYDVLHQKKAEIDRADDIIDFDEFLRMDKISLKKCLVNVIITSVVLIVFFIFLNRFLYLNTAFNFFEIITYPFTILAQVLAI